MSFNKWIQVVPEADLVDGECYFLGKKLGAPGRESIFFYGQGLNGKYLWTIKPGIAIHAICNEKFRGQLRKSENYVAVKIPSDHASRWNARKPRRIQLGAR